MRRPGLAANLPARKGMVGWYDPAQLGRTAIEVIVSLALGTRADYRVIEALAEKQEPHDYGDRAEIWIDYLADTGDGWDSTYSIASLVARPALTLATEGGDQHETRRGSLLVLGGDQVYPTASREEYRARLVAPFETALRITDPPHPHVFAIPGNHDWYDGLVNFTRLFCQDRWLGGWQTRQRRSYFAIKLPHGWWLVGVDIQLESDVDRPQLEYFREMGRLMQPGDRIILCTAEPDWIYGNIYDPRLRKNLAFLESAAFGHAKIVVTLAGDLHHYRRHEAADGSGSQKITAGGGGAFLHPTHGESVDRIGVGPEGQVVEYRLAAEFPDRRVSRLLALRNLAFPLWNPWFGGLTALAYLMIAWTLPRRWYDLRAILLEPSAVGWMVAILVAFWLFTDTHKRWYRYVGGTAHGVAHLAGAFVAVWLATRVTEDWLGALGLSGRSALQPLLAGAVVLAAGYIFGSSILGGYLLISLNVFGRHSNEAFSSLRIPDYKNFVRLHIDPDGALTIYPVGVRRVPRRWRWAEPITDRAPRLVPAEGQTLTGKLIEDPLRLR